MEPNHSTHRRPGRRTGRVRKVLFTAVALAVVTASACKTDQQPDQQTAPQPEQQAAQQTGLPVTGEGAREISDAVDDRVVGFLLDNALPGATLGITRGSRLVWSKGYGYANLDEQTTMQPWHRSRIGSVSKIITTASVLQLVEDGKLDLDQPIYGDPGPFQDINTPWPSADKNDWVVPTSVLETPEMYWSAMLDGVRDRVGPNQVNSEINKYREWASQITVRHLLSHTSGFLRSGTGRYVDAYYGREMRDYRGVHLAVLKGVIEDGKGNRLAPLEFEPGTEWNYSNHGFGLLGHIVEEASEGPRYNGYYDYTRQHVLDRLGLHDVVPNNTRLDDGLDAWPHGSELDPDKPALFQSTGGWSASASDLARIMCGLDQTSNNLRLLEPDTVTMMQSIPFPKAHGNQPHGWDRRTAGNERYKNGRTGGGTSVVMKFLPGRFDDAPDDEINVAIAINVKTNDYTLGAMEGLLRDVASKVAAADLDGGYDLFDPEHRCVGEAPTISIVNPNDGTSFPLGTEILFEAVARDNNGDPLPVTWTLPGGDTETQPGTGGQHSLFVDSLPADTHTVVATTVDAGGRQARDEVTVEVTYEAPEVAIVSPQDNATVWAGEPLDLAGQSTSGFFSLPDDQVRWEVVHGGQIVRNGTGHSLTVPGTVMEPGGYQITFTGHDDETEVSDSISITAEPKPAFSPTATINEPEADSTHTVSGGLGTVAEITFAGSAVDGDGDAIDGTYFRWTASSWGDEDVLLCAGTNTPGGPGPAEGGGDAVITTEHDCSAFNGELTGDHYAGHTNYTVTLTVWDTDGNTDTATTTVRVYVPPEG